MAKVANLKSSIQSKIQQDVTSMQQKTASSTQATQAGSTVTPEVTSTPKVTQTAKAMPSITQRPEITPVSIQTPSVTQPNVRDLLGTTSLRKAATPDLLNKATEERDIRTTTLPLNLVRASIKSGGQVEATVNESLYQQGLDWINNKFGKLEEARKNITDTVGKTAIDMFKGIGEDLSTQWKEGKGLGATKDVVLNTIQGLPRGIARVEYGLSELLDWGIDAERATNLKDSIKRDLDYWENTRTYKKVQETESFSDFLKNPLMYAGGTFTEMLPMFINAWVAVPTTYAQMYGDAYRDYAEDESLQDLTDNQIRLIATGVAGVNTIIELGADLVQGIMPWTKTVAKGTEKEVRHMLSKPISNLIRKVVRGGASEGAEEVLQNEIQTQVAIAGGSDRPAPTWGERFTLGLISSSIGAIFGGGDFTVNINRSKELKMAFDEWSEAVDNIAPGVSESDKKKLFSSIVAAEIQDANMSEKLVNKYEVQTTELYNRIDELTKELETTTDETRKTEINRQIEDANQKIKNIDEIINSANKVTEEVTAKLQELSNQKEIEELYTEVNKQIQSQREGGENLSNQAMREISEEKEVKIPDTPEGYKSLSEALKQPGNTYLTNLSDDQLKNLKRNVQKTWESEGFYGYNNSAYRFIIKAINTELEQRRNEETISSTKKLKFKNAQDFVNKMIAIDKKNGSWSKSVDRHLREKYFSWFLRNNIEGDFSAHLPGLKGINLKQIEKELTDKNLRDIAEMIALVSKTFGIDFNKIINDSNISINIVDDQNKFLYNTHSYGLMDWMPTKEQVLDLIKRTGRGNMGLAGDIIKMGVAITLDRGPEWSGSTMAHELMHLLDFAISTEEGLPLKYDNGTYYTSSIEGDYGWKTYTIGTYRPSYYNRWTEILARYAQQYYSWKNHPEVFKEYCKKDWYWTEEEFLKLVPKFEQFIKDRLGAKLLDEENQFYYDIVRKMNENKFATISTEFDREDLKEDDVKFKLTQLEEEYGFIMTHLSEMTGTLKEEMEAYVQLSNLQSNYEMAVAKGEEYLEKLNTTPEQQDIIDNITETVLPPEPVPGNPNPSPSDNPEVIRQGLPYFGGSNIEEGIGDIIKGGEGEKLGESYMKEEDIIKIRNRKNKIKGFFKECGQAFKDVFTPAISRIYNISPRVAGRLVTMETQKDINIYRYRQKAKGFVETLGGLKGNNALEVKMALLDYGALASEQGENIEQYKKDEVAKLKEVLLRNGFKEKDINDMFDVLNDIGRQYQDAGLKLVTTDLYFPRVVKDYEGLIDYMNRVSGKDIKVNKISLMMKIRNIQSDINLTDEEKEAKIRRAISIEFNQPGTTSQHGKERKMGKLSDWGEGIFAYYESPIESIDHYITTMVNAIQRQLFLGGMKEDADITEGDVLNQSTAESVSTIIGKLVEQGKVSEDDIEELQKSILAVLNKKPSPKSVTAIKDITYISTITNFLSAINQLDDLGMVILKDKSGLKHIVKTIAGRAGIKYNDLGLEDAYEMFREEGGITNWLFKKSFFNMFDRLGKTSFINTAWESMVHQAKNEKTRNYLYTRLQSMYGTESADRMMEKIDSNDYKDSDGQIDIEILRDLLYQLGSTQPIYTSAMPVTYLNHPWARLSYALSSFTLKRMDWLVQGFKEVNARHGKVAAGAWVMSVSFFLAMFGAAIGDIGDVLKGKKEDTFLWNLINKGIDEALAAGGSDMLDSWLKIWDLSEYDLKTLDRQGMQGLIGSKISPFIFDLGKDVIEAVWEHDANEITDLAKYVPIFGKLSYYWFWDELESVTKPEEDEWDFSGEEEWDFSGEEEWDFSGEEEWDFS